MMKTYSLIVYIFNTLAQKFEQRFTDSVRAIDLELARAEVRKLAQQVTDQPIQTINVDVQGRFLVYCAKRNTVTPVHPEYNQAPGRENKYR